MSASPARRRAVPVPGRYAARAPASSANLGAGFDCLGIALDRWLECEVQLLPAEAGRPAEPEEAAGQAGDDLVLRAFLRTLEAAGADRRRWRVRVARRSQIPVGRGLGSSAAAVAAGVVAANRALGEALGGEELLALATAEEGHPDNAAAALLGGLTAAAAVDGRVVAVRLEPPPGLHFAALVPERPLFTRASRAVLPATVAWPTMAQALQQATALVAAVVTGRLELLPLLARGDLHERPRAALVPGLGEAMESLRRAGLPVTLSGSGPSLLVWLYPEGSCRGRCEEAALAAALQLLEHAGTPARLLRLRPALAGASARRLEPQLR
ncbi:MAG: homoserine kinase [Bacillota bacterium]|nr:homoserine kinase [Bacillota bacterium]